MKRYKLIPIFIDQEVNPKSEMFEDPDGEWVKYNDVQSAIQENDDLHKIMQYI